MEKVATKVDKLEKSSNGPKRKGSLPGEHRGGRKPGIPNRKTAAKVATIEASGLTPLDYMLSVLRDGEQPSPIRLDAARSCAPYVHAKLSSVEVKGDGGGPVLHSLMVRFV